MNKYCALIAIVAMITTTAGCMPPSQGLNNAPPTVLPATDTLATQVPVNNTPVAGTTNSLVNALVQQLGITSAQATGGAGSIFSVAKQSMTPGNFQQLSQAVPGISQYLSAAPKMSTSTSGSAALINAASSALGNSGGTMGNLANMAGVLGAFQSLGLNYNMISQFIPIILQYVQTQGGANTMALLQSALMP